MDIFYGYPNYNGETLCNYQLKQPGIKFTKSYQQDLVDR